MQNYLSDAPLNDPEFDEFNRFPFSQRIAEVIASRSDSSSIVIGINGAWGDGKTTVLNFMERELEKENHVVCLKFNPWRFEDEDQMLINFFSDLAKAIDRSIETGKEKIGDFLERYGIPIASVVGRREFVNGVKSFFSSVDIEELRERVENLLENAQTRVVVLIDDIDRLEKREIHALFRLVKLTADFKYTAYVLSFDKTVVSAALQEHYGNNTSGIGSSFLEKIIQVPLELPSIDSEDLRDFYFNELNQLLNFAKVELQDEEARLFVTNFTTGFESHLRTPRQVKLYTNILMFSLPILKGEANVVDLMLIEGVRVFLPDVYVLIRDNKELFLTDDRNSISSRASEQMKDRKKEKIEECLQKYSREEKEGIQTLLCFLFPKINNLFKNVHYGIDMEEQWHEKQRICSPQYFQRYFTYAITTRDVSDAVIRALIRESENQSTEVIKSKIRSVITDKNVDVFISKLRKLSIGFSAQQSKTIALSMAQLGHTFPNPIQLFRSMNSFGQAAMLIGNCIENIREKKTQKSLGKQVINNASNLPFAAECLKWFKRDTEEYPDPNGFSEEEFRELSEEMAKRISSELKNPDNLVIDDLESVPFILALWRNYGLEGEATAVITKKIENEPSFVFDFLNSYTSYSFSELGVNRTEFNRESFEEVKKIVKISVIKEAIRQEYDDLIIDKSFPEFLKVPREEELARQFLWLDNKISNDEAEFKQD